MQVTILKRELISTTDLKVNTNIHDKTLNKLSAKIHRIPNAN